MTMAELEALGWRYFPSEMARIAEKQVEQGRAGVTMRANQSDRYGSPGGYHFSASRIYCEVCGKEVYRKRHRKYCSDACKQKAYRQRRKQAAA